MIKSQEISDEQAKKRKDEEERRRRIREELAQQIMYKKERKISEKEFDGSLMKAQSENNERYYKNVREMKQNLRKENIRALEITENLAKSIQRIK